MKKLILSAFLCFLSIPALAYTTYYVRTDGGTSTQCTGTTDAAYTSGVGQPCAFSHPNWAISPIGNNPTKMVGGDTLIIDGSSSAKYQMGFGSPNSSDTAQCYVAYPYNCTLRNIPSGPDTSHPTRIVGKGFDSGCSSPPQLWGNERLSYILNLKGSNNVEVQCLEVTDHSACIEFGPGTTACNRSTYPFGPWASTGIEAADSSNVLIKNVNVHGIAHTGIHAGRLNNWTIQNSNFNTNALVGWDGDIGTGVSSNSGTILFDTVQIKYNGCGETYPGGLPYSCFSQDQGGYGDGLGTQQTGGDWTFNNVDFSYNVSDGLDLLYHNGNGSITITNSTFTNNTGNQVKVATSSTVSGTTITGDCAYLSDHNYVYSPSTFNNCRAGADAFIANIKTGKQIRITNSVFSTIRGTDAVASTGSACNGTEVFGVDTATTFDLRQRYLQPGTTATKYYAGGSDGNGSGSCGTLPLSTIASSCTTNGSCTATIPACGSITYGVDNCGNQCSKVGAVCPTCTPNGSCTAATPGCSQVTTGVDNCGNVCTRTGAACPTCSVTTCNAPAPSCGQVTTGIDNCGGTCSKTGVACCVPDGSCTAATPSCGATTNGVDNCGTVCHKTGAPCCVPNGSCSAASPACGTTTTGLDNCGNSCIKTGIACCVSTTQCSAPTPACSKTTTGVDNCGKPCSKTGSACTGAITYNLNWNDFKRNSIKYTTQVKLGNTVNFSYGGNDFQVIIYKSIQLPSTTRVFTLSMAWFTDHVKRYTDFILTGAKVYIIGYNNGSYEIKKKP